MADKESGKNSRKAQLCTLICFTYIWFYSFCGHFSYLFRLTLLSIRLKSTSHSLSRSVDFKDCGVYFRLIAEGPKCRSQVTGQVTGSRPQVRLQVTGHRPGLRSDHRSGHRSHTKTIGHWTKLFLIDILLYKLKQAKEPQLYFFLFWTLPNPTHEKIYSCLSGKEDLRYSVTKVGNEITKVRKITWFVRKNESQNEGLLR